MIILLNGYVAQWLRYGFMYTYVAQWLEHLTGHQKVKGCTHM